MADRLAIDKEMQQRRVAYVSDVWISVPIARNGKVSVGTIADRHRCDSGCLYPKIQWEHYQAVA